MMLETDLTSDILVYNILRKSEDVFIKEFNLKFIDRSVPAEESNTIYVAMVDLELRDETFEAEQYNSLVNIFVKTKNTDYLEGSQYLRTVVRHIKNALKYNPVCKRRNIIFRNMTYEYGSKYTLKGIHLLVQFHEWEQMNEDPELVSHVDLETGVIVTDDITHPRKK